MFAMALHVAGARAGDPATPMFSLSGFGTLGYVHSSENRADFASSAFRPNGAGHSRAWSADVDSRIGAQVAANFTPQVSAVLQVISEQRYDNSYTPAVEWANIKYQFTPNFSVRAGRIVLPVFLVSDYRKVGYAYPWVRPPVEFYAQLPVSNSDGVDVTYRAHIGNLTSTVQGTYGRTETGIPGGRGTANAKDLWGIAYTGEYGAVTAHLAYFRANVTVEAFKPFFDGFRRFGAAGIALADKYDYDNKPYTFFGLGGMYNPRDWFVMGEWGVSDRRSVIGKRIAWYMSGGYRLGKFTPYLTYAQVDTDSRTSDPGLTLSGLPPVLAAPAAGLNTGLNDLLASSPAQKTISAGVRWDFAKNAALKLQFDQTRLGAGSPGMLINLQPGFQTGGKFNVFSATVDFVF
jgi:hypothetical protein